MSLFFRISKLFKYILTQRNKIKNLERQVDQLEKDIIYVWSGYRILLSKYVELLNKEEK